MIFFFFCKGQSHVIYLRDILQEQEHPAEVPHFAAVAVPSALIIVLHLGGAFFHAYHPLLCGLERRSSGGSGESESKVICHTPFP